MPAKSAGDVVDPGKLLRGERVEEQLTHGPTMTEFQDFQTFTPHDHQVDLVNTLFDQLISWSQALEGVRTTERAELVV